MPAASAIVDLSTTFGELFIGLVLSTILFGLGIAQTWIYFWHYGNKDPKGLQLFIAFILVVDIFHTSLCIYMLYWYLVPNFGNLENLDNSIWPFDVQANISGIYISSVHLYYARRVYIVTRNIIFPIIMVCIIIAGNALGYVVTAKELGVKQFSKRHYNHWLTEAGMLTAVAVDVMTASIMCWCLYRMKTGFVRTDSMIKTLMAYTINSGLVTSLLTISMIISFMVAPSTLLSYAIFWVVCKCWINSLLATLNSRDYIRDRSTPDHSDAFNLSSIRIGAPSEAYGDKSRQTRVSVIMHPSTGPDSATSKSDHNVGPTFEVPKPDTTVIPC